LERFLKSGKKQSKKAGQIFNEWMDYLSLTAGVGTSVLPAEEVAGLGEVASVAGAASGLLPLEVSPGTAVAPGRTTRIFLIFGRNLPETFRPIACQK
jgi:hypothetical protein